ncbi:MAG: nucleotidyltransferase family protein [Candidatus Nealsonbacteria bacterium DGGOD1a]|jgi:predicted nucleotidyltransferase|nr:MAG: nucleotidyltransferase family protein [Candidatus Nealsonbacteria bacterium DGGOD1a]
MKKVGFINSKNRAKLNAIFKEYGVVKAAVFGSYARGDERKRSDIDFLIKMESGRSLMDLGGLKVDLEKLFGRKVDLVEYECIHPKLKKEILGEQVPIL